MQFLYIPESGDETIRLKDEPFRHLMVRREKKSEIIKTRNLKDSTLYSYKIESISKKEALLRLVEKKELEIVPKRFLHLCWCIIDPKAIEKSLPTLNEIGVAKISFVYCQRSQRNFKVDLKRCEKILINSSQQCGRSNIIELELVDDLKKLIDVYEDIVVLDFGGTTLFDTDIKRVLIGPEGGFSDDERELLSHFKKISFDTNTILKSESAAVGIAAKVLL